MKKLFLLVTGLVFAFQMRVHADEGMWLLSLIGQVNMDEMTEMGLQLTAEQIYSINQASLKDAVGALDGGSCTAELVSPDGLLLTNHHCGYGEIQNHSSLEHDYLKNGFWAMTRDEELPNEGKTITFLVRMEEVTDRIAPELNEEMNSQARASKIRLLSETISTEASEGTHYDARVRSMFNGNRYFLFVTETYRDVRLVGAPPESIGKFGHDTDNWMWPRHTGDFSFLRAYVGPDGKPADYSPENVPFHPRRYLKINPRGVNEEDLVFLLGYPGRTYRHRTSYFIAFEKEIRMPYVVQANAWMISVLETLGHRERSVELKLVSRIKNFSNRLKNYRGKLIGLEKIGLIGEKTAQESRLQKFILSKSDRQNRYGTLLERIKKFYQQKTLTADFELVMGFLKGSSYLLYTAHTLYEASIERKKDDSERKPAYMDRKFERTRKRLMLRLKDFHQPADAVIFKEFLMRTLKLKGQRITGVDRLLGIKDGKTVEADLSGYEQPIDDFLKKAYAETRLTRPEVVEKLFALNSLELKKINDPFMDLAISMYPQYRKLDEISKQRKGIMDDLSAQLSDIKKQFLGRDFIPDANSTLRLTFGHIRGYYPRDAVYYRPLTTLKGIVEKNTGCFPFRAPPRLLELFRQRDFGPFKHPGLNDVP
ncbi:MAG: S46 family peptidase, partial [Bacteroidales bacterium]|nr:S46 family peptidase [Bacteroidales bacterium]